MTTPAAVTPTPTPTPAPITLVGLSVEQTETTAEDFFASFSWAPLVLDAEALSAERFLSLL